MSTTVNELFIQVMGLADEMTDTINVLNETDVASYKARTPAIVNLLQAELIKIGDIYNTFEFSNKPLTPLMGEYSGFDYVRYEGEEKTIEMTGSAKAYHLEVDGEATIYIEDYTGSWNTLATISATDPTTRKYTAYKGVVTPTAGATKSRIRLSGSYEYVVTNYALWDYPLKSARIPTYRPYFKVDMPSDFKSVGQILNEYPNRQYSEDSHFKWENNNELWVDYFYEGNIRVNYHPVPTNITAMTDSLSVDDVTARTILAYGVGAELFKEENQDIYSHFMRRYNELKSTAMPNQKASEQPIVNIYGGW